MPKWESKMTLVSVIIPTYNREAVLPRAIRSVLSQDYTNIEVIVVDDCSTDGTQTVMSEIKDPRVRLIKHELNKGAGAARNTGIKAAKGEVIAFQDSDDEWLDGKLSRQIEVLKHADSDCVCVYSAFINYGRDTHGILGVRRVSCVPSVEIEEEKLKGDLQNIIWSRSLISTQTMVCWKKDLEQVGGFDERLPNLIDWDIVIRLSEIGNLEFVNSPLVNTYTQTDSISSISRKLPFSQLRIINKLKRRERNRFLTDPIITNRLARVGWWFGKIGQTSRGDILLRASLAANPTNMKTWFRFLANRLRGLLDRSLLGR